MLHKNKLVIGCKKKKSVAGYEHDVIDCDIVPYDVGDNFRAKFSILCYLESLMISVFMVLI